jgi:hypothetical protein
MPLLVPVLCAVPFPDTHIVAIQKDEGRYLQDWIDWHSFLLGEDALTVVDHNSSDPTTKAVLQTWHRRNNNRSVSFHGPFPEKHNILTEVLRQQTTALIMPLDVDEYLLACLHKEAFDPEVHRSSIHEKLRLSIKESAFEKFKLGVYATTCSWPFNATCHFSANPPRSMDKTYYRRTTFKATDQGNHRGKTLHDRVQQTRHLCIYHRPKHPDEMWTKSLRNALSYGYFVENRSNIVYVQRKVCKGIGYHYCTYVKNNAKKYGVVVKQLSSVG